MRIGKPEYCIQTAVPYLLIHAVGAVCAYKEWAPASFNTYPKDVMQFQILINFILINAIPLIEVKITLFLMFPVLLVASYLQLTEEKRIMRLHHLTYTPEQLAHVRSPEAYFSTQFYRVALIGGIFICAHYIQQLDISRLTIQKYIIKKQQ